MVHDISQQFIRLDSVSCHHVTLCNQKNMLYSNMQKFNMTPIRKMKIDDGN